MSDILIKTMATVTMCDECGVIENAYIHIKDNVIEYVGTQKPDGSFDRIIDAEGMVAMPGLVNAHTHTAMTVLRSYADDMNLQDWLFEKIFPFEDTLTPELVYKSSVNGIKEMLSTGTTCFNDMYFFQQETANAARELGMRGVLNEGITDSVLDIKIKKTEALNLDCLHKKGISPHAVYTCNPDTLKGCALYAKKHNMRIHTHLSETEKENEDCIKEYGMTPTELMEKCGVFDVPTTAAHCVWLSEGDMEILKKHNVTVVHNPISNLKLASGIADIPRIVQKGINVALGTDGASSNNNLDMFEEIKLMGILHKGVKKDPTVLPAWDVLKAATVNGARALGYDNLGMLKKGYLADLILVDFDVPHLTPNNNAVSNLAYAVRGSDVAYTVADGKIVYERGKSADRFLTD